MFDPAQLLDDFFKDVRDGTVVFLGLLCFLVFVVNAVVLIWLAVRRGSSTIARCPRCGRSIVCMHCDDEESSTD